MKFDVHLFPIVRVKVVGVEAVDEVGAIKNAEDIDLNGLFESASGYLRNYYGSNRPLHLEYAEEVSHYLVDPEPAPGVVVLGVWFGPGYERDDPDPKGRKAGMLDKILACEKVLPMLIGIDPDLDREIACRLK